MTTLTTKKRKGLKKTQFGDPAHRKYPINDRSHAANAKARVEQQFKAGHVSKSYKDKIDAAANKVLKK